MVVSRRTVLATLGAGILLPIRTAEAQSFPNRPIRIIVPFPAGGPTDILSRVIAQKMSEDWGQPVVIENRPGADTAIGAVQVAKAPPDGYTSLLTVRAEGGPKTIPELIARAKASGKMNYGAGIITTRLAGYMFNRAAGISVQLIPYKGSAEVVQGLLTGAVDYIIDGTASSLPLIKSGKFRPLAKLNSRPLPALPDVPPLSEAAGMPELDDMSSWIALVAPAGTPRAIVDRLQAKVAAIYADRATHDRLIAAGINPVSSTPEEFDAFFRKEAVRWTTAFKASGIKLD